MIFSGWLPASRAFASASPGNQEHEHWWDTDLKLDKVPRPTIKTCPMGITSNYHTWNNVIITFISFYEERQTLPASPSSLIRCQSRSTSHSRPAPDSLTASAWSHLTCAAEERNQKLGNDPPWQRKPFPTNLSTGKYLVTNKSRRSWNISINFTEPSEPNSLGSLACFSTFAASGLLLLVFGGACPMQTSQASSSRRSEAAEGPVASS